MTANPLVLGQTIEIDQVLLWPDLVKQIGFPAATRMVELLREGSGCTNLSNSDLLIGLKDLFDLGLIRIFILPGPDGKAQAVFECSSELQELW